MIDPTVKAEIRNHIVRANMALHRGNASDLYESLKKAEFIAGSLAIEQVRKDQIDIDYKGAAND